MIDKIVIRIATLIIVIFIVIAVLYERPEKNGQRADYLPAKDFIGDSKKGRRLFDANCISCHGADLKGSNKGPSLLHPYYKPNHHGDVSIYLAVYQGVQQHHWQFGNMPAFKKLTPEDAEHLLKYIRQQQRINGLF